MIIITAICHVSGPVLSASPHIISYHSHGVSVRQIVSPFPAVETRSQVGTEFGSIPSEVQGTLILGFLTSEPELLFNHYTIS